MGSVIRMADPVVKKEPIWSRPKCLFAAMAAVAAVAEVDVAAVAEVKADKADVTALA